MKSHSHIGFWFTLALVSFLCAPMFMSASYMRERMGAEVDGVRAVFGVRIGNLIVGGANAVHGAFERIGGEKMLQSGIHTREEKATAEKYMTITGSAISYAADTYFSGLIVQVYSLTIRFLSVVAWVLLLLPFLVAAVVDGLSARAAKLSEFGYQNPTAFALGTHFVIFVSALPLIYVALPFQVTPLFMPWWALIAALPAAFAISHMQPVFTR